MTNSKAYNIQILCKLKGIDVDSEEAQAMNSWTVLELLNAIKECRENANKAEPEEEEEEDISLSRRVGAKH